MAITIVNDFYEASVGRTDSNLDGTSKVWNGFSGGIVPSTAKSYRIFDWCAAANGWDANQFTITEVGTATQTLSDVDDGGAVILLNSAADNDATVVRQGKGTDGSGGLWLTHKAGKYIFIEGTFKISDATQSDMYFGIFNKSTDPVGTIPTSGFFFRKDDGDTQLDCISVKSGPTDTTSSTNVATMDTGYHKYSIRILGNSQAEFFLDDTRVALHTATGNFPLSTTFMAPHLCIQNGEAVAKSMTLKDWTVAAQR